MSDSFNNDNVFLNSELLQSIERMLSKDKAEYHDTVVFESMIDYLSSFGRLKDALKISDLAIGVHSNSDSIILKLANLHLYNHNITEAENTIQYISSIETKNAEFYLLKGNIESRKGNSINAINFFRKAIKTTNYPEDIYPFLATELRHSNKELEAKYFIKKHLNILPSDEYAVTLFYDIIENNQEIDEGIEFFNQIIKKDPYNHLIWFYLGLLHKGQRNYKEAFRSFEFCYFIDKYFIGAYHELSTLYYKQNDYSKSIELLEEVVEIEEPYALTFARLSKLYRLNGNAQKALFYANKTCKEDPQLDLGWRELAIYFKNSHNYSEYLSNIKRAHELDPYSKTNSLLYAKALQEFDKWEDSKNIYLDLIKHNGLEKNIIKNLIICYIRLNDIEKGLNITDKTSNLSKDVDFLYFKAYFYYKKGSIEESIILLTKALNENNERIITFKVLMNDFFEEQFVKILINKK